MFLEIHELRKSFGAGENRTEVLKGLDFSVEKGEICVLLGPSGSGKSTLLNIISGLEPADSGAVLYDDKNIIKMTDAEITSFRKDTIGYVFQQYFLLPNLNVDKNVKMGADLAKNKNYRVGMISHP